MSRIQDTLGEHVELMNSTKHRNRIYTQHWNNESPAAWLSSESREALDGKLVRVSVNFIRLAVRSLVERLTLRGFSRDGESGVDRGLLKVSQLVDLSARAETLHVDRALYGAAYATVWATADGRQPVLLTDTGENVSVERDPATGEIRSGARVWRDGDRAFAVLMDRDTVRRFSTPLVEGGELTGALEWQQLDAQDNALETVPIVPFIRQQSTHDTHGVSAVADIVELVDALAKALGDAMVTSEYYAKPRRYATGLEIMEDEDGNPVDPFGKSRLLQSESPDTKFGQLPASTPSGQVELIATLTQQIGALTGLPAHYMGLHGNQPASAEGVRAAETQLVTAARTEMRSLDGPWGRVADLLAAVRDGGHPADYGYSTHWENPEIKTPAQAADAAGKLRDIGIPLETLLREPLGFDPENIDDIVAKANQERIVSNMNLGGGYRGTSI